MTGLGKRRSQWEMYDLLKDPLERSNLAGPDYRPTQEQAEERARLTAKLERAQRFRYARCVASCSRRGPGTLASRLGGS
jgi:hypothetical protein